MLCRGCWLCRGCRCSCCARETAQRRAVIPMHCMTGCVIGQVCPATAGGCADLRRSMLLQVLGWSKPLTQELRLIITSLNKYQKYCSVMHVCLRLLRQSARCGTTIANDSSDTVCCRIKVPCNTYIRLISTYQWCLLWLLPAAMTARL